MTNAPQNEPNETTPVPSGNEDTTPPQAETQGTTPKPEGGNAQPDIDKIVQKRLDRERKKWEAEREELEKRARMDEAERLKADLADRDKRIAEAEAKTVMAERRASLTGKVADPTAALRLVDEAHLTEDGSVNIDALLETYPFLAPSTRPSAPAAQGQPDPASKTGNLTPQDFAGKPQAWITDNLHRLKPPTS